MYDFIYTIQIQDGRKFYCCNMILHQANVNKLCVNSIAATTLTMSKATVGQALHGTQGGVHSIKTNQASMENDESMWQKSSNRKPTPANPHQVKRTTNIPALNPTIEVEEVELDDTAQMTMSPEAQAHSLSLFLSSSTSDSGRAQCH